MPRPEKEEEEKGPGFSHSRMRLIAVELPCACDANIDTRRYTVRRFIIAAYDLQRNSLDCTHPAADLKL